MTGAVVLAGGRSRRMGTPKAQLAWRGGTLLGYVVGVVGAAVDGPVVVVRTPGQELPDVGPGVRVVDDTEQGLGPLHGLAIGLSALEGEAETAFVAATDLPFLHPAFVRAVLHGFETEDVDVVLPQVRGHHQPLAAAYRTRLAPLARTLVSEGHRAVGDLFGRCRVLPLDERGLLTDVELARVDPGLDSVLNVNSPEEYDAALSRAGLADGAAH